MYKSIEDLPLPAEQIDKELFYSIPPQEYQYCEMDEIEKRFLFGLIRHFKPKDILEVGVSSGGGSGLILSAISDCPDATLTSIDFATNAYKFKNEKVGFVAQRKHSDNEQWNLIHGKDSSEVIEGLDKKFDFAIIDTAHIHPIETLNFLSVLPFLKKGAIVVLHDISFYLSNSEYRDMYRFPVINLATRYLFNAVAAKKSMPKKYRTDLETQLVNIGAFQVSDDTLNYIENVFQSLYVPWGVTPEKRILDGVSGIVERHFPKRYAQMFAEAIRVNAYLKCKELKSVNDLAMIMRKCEEKYILFGARDAKHYIEMINGAGFGLPMEIWDNRDLSFQYEGITAKKPHFDIPRDVAVIFTVRSQITFNDIVNQWPKEIKLQTFFLEH